MMESLEAIRSLGLAAVFEELYHGRPISSQLRIYMSYPARFRDSTLEDWGPLTAGGLVPIVDDGNFDQVCLYDAAKGCFVLKLVEEPADTVEQFDSFQQFLAYALMEIADSGLSDDELAELAEAVGFRYLNGLLSLLGELDSLSDAKAEKRAAQFVASCR